MSRARVSIALRQVEKLWQARTTGDLADGQLVERFADQRDEAAFAALVERHGAMVFGVCLRLLRHRQDAEDAFQATFLVLARRARSLRRPEAVGTWLYEVAYRIALRARQHPSRGRYESMQADPAVKGEEPAEYREVLFVLDDELQRLPAKYKIPLLLCYFENKTYNEAAQALGWPSGTVSGRLARAREILRKRLTQRGVAISSVALVTFLAETELARAASSGLAASTVRVAVLTLQGAAAAGALGVQAAAWSEQMVQALWLTKVKTIAALCLLAGVLLGVGGVVMHGYLGDTPAQQAHKPQEALPRSVASEAINAADASADEPENDKIKNAIAKAVDFLKQQQHEGNWELPSDPATTSNKGGLTSLILLALLEAGVRPDDNIISRGVNYVRPIKPSDTYVVALQTALLARVDPKKDNVRIKWNVDWLLLTAVRDSNQTLAGWGYASEKPRECDNSNTQYAVFALHEAAKAGIKIEEKTWKDIRELYTRTQLQGGGWPYRNTNAGFGKQAERLTMTCAGACGLYIANHHLKDQDGPAKEPIAKALENIANHFTINDPSWKFYNLHCLARVGQLSGLRDFAGKTRTIAWYREGVADLLNSQSPEGCWRGNGADGNPLIATSFALLFLSSKDGIIRK